MNQFRVEFLPDFRVQFQLSMVIAVLLGEAQSALFYASKCRCMRCFNIGQRYMMPALLSDMGLVILIQYAMENHWSVYRLNDALSLGLWIGLVYFCLEAPHVPRSCNMTCRFCLHALHKVTISQTMCWALFFFRDIA